MGFVISHRIDCVITLHSGSSIVGNSQLDRKQVTSKVSNNKIHADDLYSNHYFICNTWEKTGIGWFTYD